MFTAIIGLFTTVFSTLIGPFAGSVEYFFYMQGIRFGLTDVPVLKVLGGIRYILGDKLYTLIYYMVLFGIGITLWKAIIAVVKAIVDMSGGDGSFLGLGTHKKILSNFSIKKEVEQSTSFY